MKKMTFFIALSLAAVFLTAGCLHKTPEAKKSIKIGINVWPGYAHAFLAQEKGMFKKNGVDVEFVLRKDMSENIKLYQEGEVDGLFCAYPDILIFNSEGIPTKVVYVADYSDTGDVIIGKPEFKSLRDLKGKKVGCEGINTFSHLFVLKALEKAGLKEIDLQFARVPALDVLTELEKGVIDAGHTWEPVTSQALKKGYKILGKAGDVPGIITDVLAFSAQLIDERPDDVLRIVKSLLEARDFIYSNREEALAIMSRAEGMSSEEIKAGLKGVYQPDRKENIQAMERSKKTTSLYGSGRIIAEFYLNRGQISRTFDFDQIVEPQFVARAGGASLTMKQKRNP
jgi:NitT/TauT family transport system substrate-binding protein